MRRWITTALLALGLLTGAVALDPRPAFATVLPDWGLEELVANSDAVVIARVGEVGTQLDAQDGFVYTVTVLQIEEYVMGAGPERVRIRQSGGRVGDHTVIVPGHPRLVTGQRVVLFLEQREPYQIIVAMELGAFFIEGPPETSVVRRPTTVAVAAFDAHGEMSLRHPTTPFEGAPLDQLLNEIRTLASTGGRRR